MALTMQLDCQPDAASSASASIDDAYAHAHRNSPCRRDLVLEDRLPGPLDPEESMLWAVADLRGLTIQGLKWFQCDFGRAARRRINQGIALTTDYSGIGCPEEALRQFFSSSEFLALRLGEDWDPAGEAKCYCLRAGDMSKHCRTILANPYSRFSPQCLHGDIMERCPKKLKERMEKMRQRALDLVQKAQERGKPKESEALLEVGRNLVRKIAKFMLQGTAASHETALLNAHCYKCKKNCSVIQRPFEEDDGVLRLHVAGVNCYDWSSMGQGSQWLGESLLPFVQWCKERLVMQEDLILVECVLNFDDTMLAELFAEDYDLLTLRVSPTLLGEPVERGRKYMILLRKEKLEWHPAIAKANAVERGSLRLESAFSRLFARTLRMSGDMKFRAPQDDIAARLQTLAAAKKLPRATRSGRGWSSFQLCSQAMRDSVNAHESWLRSHIGAGGSFDGWICNLAQRPAFMPPTQHVVPALLRKSQLWLMAKARRPLPMEMLEVQGWNIWGFQPARVMTK